MAVELHRLYQEIYSDYEVRLLTKSCFNQKIEWIHIVENSEFTDLLHNDILVFNSTLNDVSEEMRKDYIDRLISVQAGGLIVSLQENHDFSTELIEYCNQKEFPLFRSEWTTPYLKIMRRFSEILLDNERSEMNLIAAIKNAISHPDDEAMYLQRFEQNRYTRNEDYVISIISSIEPEIDFKISRMRAIEKAIQVFAKKSVVFEEKGNAILLTSNLHPEILKKNFEELQRAFPTLQISIGSLENSITFIYKSHHNAWITHNVQKKAMTSHVLNYDDIGTFQVLANINEPTSFYPIFIQKTLGKLIDYDEKHRTDYMDVLKLYFENNCSITQTANESFYHQNTLKYKIKAIKDILGYDITTNENRVRIMICLYVLKTGNLVEK